MRLLSDASPEASIIARVGQRSRRLADRLQWKALVIPTTQLLILLTVRCNRWELDAQMLDINVTEVFDSPLTSTAMRLGGLHVGLTQAAGGERG